MTGTEFFVTFFVYGFLGWMIDSAYRSYTEKKLVSRTFLGIPFTPIYGFGALIVLAMYPLFESFPLTLEWLLFALTLGFFEYLSGLALHRIMHRRLWNYSGERGSVKGYTDFFHAAAWGVFALVLIHVIHPFVTGVIEQIYAVAV